MKIINKIRNSILNFLTKTTIQEIELPDNSISKTIFDLPKPYHGCFRIQIEPKDSEELPRLLIFCYISKEYSKLKTQAIHSSYTKDKAVMCSFSVKGVNDSELDIHLSQIPRVSYKKIPYSPEFNNLFDNPSHSEDTKTSFATQEGLLLRKSSSKYIVKITPM